MPSCTHDYSPSNQYFVTSAPGAKTRRSKSHNSHQYYWQEEAQMLEEAYQHEQDLSGARHGLNDTNKHKHIPTAEEKEKKETDKLRQHLRKQFTKLETLWLYQ